MNCYLDLKNKSPFPYKKISFGNHKYKIINDKYNKLKEDFKIFLDEIKDEKKKIIKKRKKFSLSMFKFIENLASETFKNNTNLIGQLNMNNYQKINKRFLSAKEIHIYKENKIKLLNLIRHKSKSYNKNNLINKSNKKIKSRNQKNRLFDLSNSNNTFLSFKFNNSYINNKISLSTKFIKSHFSFKNKTAFNERNKNQKNLNNIKSIKLIKKFNLRDRNNDKKDSYSNSNINNNISSNEIYEKEYGNTYNNNISSEINLKNSLTNIDNIDNIFDSHLNEDTKDVYKKIYLKKLKKCINKFEKSKKSLPDYDIIEKNSYDPNNFKRKKLMKKNEVDNLNNNKKLLKRICSAPKISQRLNKTKISSRKEKSTSKRKSKDNTKILIKKINNINFNII